MHVISTDMTVLITNNNINNKKQFIRCYNISRRKNGTTQCLLLVLNEIVEIFKN